MRLTENKLRRIICEEASKLLTEQYRASEFVDDLKSALGDKHMGYTVEKADTDTIRFFTNTNGQRIHVHAIPFFNGRTEDMTVSIAINDETVRQGLAAFYGESMVQELQNGNPKKAAEMYKDGVNPLLEAGYGLAKIRKV